MTSRLPSPGPSFLKELELRPGGPHAIGIARPQTLADDWWVTLLWCEGLDGVATFRELGPSAGPPPGNPLLRLGPSLAGELSGLILEEDGRQQLRLRLGQPPVDDTRAWDAPLAVVAAFRFEPARVAAMRGTELAVAVQRAFRGAVLSLAG